MKTMNVECLYNYVLSKPPKWYNSSNLLVELSKQGFFLLEKLSKPPFILDLNDQFVVLNLSKFLWSISKSLALVSKDPIFDMDIAYAASTETISKVQLRPQTQVAYLIAKNLNIILSSFEFAIKGSISDELNIYAAIRDLYAAIYLFLKAHNLNFNEILIRTNPDYAVYLKARANA